MMDSFKLFFYLSLTLDLAMFDFNEISFKAQFTRSVKNRYAKRFCDSLMYAGNSLSYDQNFVSTNKNTLCVQNFLRYV